MTVLLSLQNAAGAIVGGGDFAVLALLMSVVGVSAEGNGVEIYSSLSVARPSSVCWGLIVVEDAVVGEQQLLSFSTHCVAGILLSSWGGFDRGLAGFVENHYSFLRAGVGTCGGVCVCTPVSPKLRLG